jgi:choline kinase
MRYLIPAAGMGRRLGDTLGGRPKCMIEIAGEPLIARLLRQIRTIDAAADIHVVLGCRSEIVAPVVGDATIILNPFFDVTGIDTSLWFARASFDRAVMVVHADLVLSESLAAALFSAEPATLMAFDSSIRDPREINIAVSGGCVTHFDENLTEFSGVYAGVLKLSGRAAAAFAESLDCRIRGGLHDPKAYYFHVVRALIEDFGIGVSAFDIAGADWQEIDRPCDIAAAKARFDCAVAADSLETLANGVA